MTTQVSPTLALVKLRQHVAEHGMPQSPQAWFALLDEVLAEPDAEKVRLEEVADRARYVYDQWILGNVSRQNGMDALRHALEAAGR